MPLHLDALAQAELVRTRQISATELATLAIERIEAVNPRINAVVHPMFEQGLRLAAGALPDGPFTGVPFLIKDLLAWYQGEPITSGSRLLRGFVAPHDSEIVTRYRRAGLVVLGKTNTPELGLLPFTEPELFGPTRNPWNTERTTGGSSGGSAAAVASGMVAMAGGGDGGGSIRIPASCCGLFGLKPTRGRTPTGPDQGEIWRGAVIEHVLTRSVRDSAAMLDAIAGPDPGAPYYAPPPARPFLDEINAPPGRLRIAFSTAPFLGGSVDPECQRAVTDTAHLLESLGHDVVEAAPPVDREAFARAFVTLICGETRADLDEAEAATGRRASLATVEASTWAVAMLGTTITAAEYSSALRALQRYAREVGRFFEDFPLWLTPTVATPPFPIGALQPPRGEAAMLQLFGTLRSGRLLRAAGALERLAPMVFEWMSYTPLANVTGQPAMSLPLAWSTDGLPIGVHIQGRYADEATLFRLASQLEQAAPWAERWPPSSGV